MKRLTAKDATERKMLQDTPTPNFYAFSCENPLLEDEDLNDVVPIRTPPIPEARSSKNIQQHQQPTPGNSCLNNMDALALTNRRCELVELSNLLGFGSGEGFGADKTFMNYLGHGHHQQDLCLMQKNCVLDVLLNNATASGLFYGHLMPNKSDFLMNTRYWSGGPTH